MNERSLRVRPGLRVLQTIYYDPVNYPPTLNATRVLADAGAEVLCLGYDRGMSAPLKLPPRAHIKYLNTNGPGWQSTPLRRLRETFSFRAEVQRAIRTFQPDLVVGYDYWGVCSLLPVRRKPICITHLHDVVDEQEGSLLTTEGLFWFIAKHNLHKFARVVVPDASRARFLTEHAGVSASFAVIGNSPPYSTPVRNRSLRTLLSIPDSEPLAVVTGMMTLGAETVRAMARARATWHLAVIGCRNQGWLNEMQASADLLDIRHRLHILPYTDYDTVRHYLLGCDLGLCFYARSTNPNWNHVGAASVKLQEYMAAGLPSLAGMKDSLGSLAEATGAIELIESDSEQAIVDRLDGLEPGSDRAGILGLAAVAAHQREYNLEAQLAPLLSALHLDR